MELDDMLIIENLKKRIEKQKAQKNSNVLHRRNPLRESFCLHEKERLQKSLSVAFILNNGVRVI